MSVGNTEEMEAVRALRKDRDRLARELTEETLRWDAERHRADAAEKHAVALEAALRQAHDCATLRDDGTCDGCFVSEILAAPANPATAKARCERCQMQYDPSLYVRPGCPWCGTAMCIEKP